MDGDSLMRTVTNLDSKRSDLLWLSTTPGSGLPLSINTHADMSSCLTGVLLQLLRTSWAEHFPVTHKNNVCHVHRVSTNYTCYVHSDANVNDFFRTICILCFHEINFKNQQNFYYCILHVSQNVSTSHPQLSTATVCDYHANVPSTTCSLFHRVLLTWRTRCNECSEVETQTCTVLNRANPAQQRHQLTTITNTETERVAATTEFIKLLSDAFVKADSSSPAYTDNNTSNQTSV